MAALHESIKFYNPTDQNFVGTWDGESYDIPAKSTKFFTSYIAEHFAKHLVNKILLERFDNLCQEHSSSTKDLLKTCRNCKTRSDKLGSFYSLPEREELLKIILPKEEIPKESKEITAVTPEIE